MHEHRHRLGKMPARPAQMKAIDARTKVGDGSPTMQRHTLSFSVSLLSYDLRKMKVSIPRVQFFHFLPLS